MSLPEILPFWAAEDQLMQAIALFDVLIITLLTISDFQPKAITKSKFRFADLQFGLTEHLQHYFAEDLQITNSDNHFV